MSTMRWADSDSDSEEEYVPPSSSPPPEEPKQPPPLPQHYQRPSQPPRDHNHGGGGGGRGGGGRGHNHSPKFERGRDSGGGGGRGGGGRQKNNNPTHQQQQRHQQPRDWKEMAKASSRFSNTQAPVDGSAWMAQRRAKMEQEEKQQKEEHEKQLQRQHEEKREQRRSQLGALKAAMKEIKESEPPPPSSPGASSRGSSRNAASPTASKDVIPKQILKRHEKDNKHRNDKSSNRPSVADSEKPFSWRKQQKSPPPTSTTISGPPKFSYTIGDSPATQPKPKAELQPDGTVKFVRQGSVGSVEGRGAIQPAGKGQNEVKETTPLDRKDGPKDISKKSNGNNKNNIDDSHVIEFDSKNGPAANDSRSGATDEYSITSRGSRQSGRGGGRGRGGGSRGGRHHHKNRKHSAGRAGDDTSISSRGKSSRGGGRGRGGRGRGWGSERGDSAQHSKDLPSSHESNGDSITGQGGRGGGKEGGRGRGRGGRDGGGRKGGGGGRSSKPHTPQNQRSTSPKPKHSYEIGAD